MITSPNLMHETGHSEPAHWDDPEGWDGEGGGRGVEGHMYTHGWFMSMFGKILLQYCKAISLQLKLINFLKTVIINIVLSWVLLVILEKLSNLRGEWEFVANWPKSAGSLGTPEIAAVTVVKGLLNRTLLKFNTTPDSARIALHMGQSTKHQRHKQSREDKVKGH